MRGSSFSNGTNWSFWERALIKPLDILSRPYSQGRDTEFRAGSPSTRQEVWRARDTETKQVVPRPAKKCGGLGTLNFTTKSKIWVKFVESFDEPLLEGLSCRHLLHPFWVLVEPFVTNCHQFFEAGRTVFCYIFGKQMDGVVVCWG